MTNKIFININLSTKNKKRIIQATQKWQNLPIKWTKEKNLHITLKFLGFVRTEVIPEICRQVSLATKNFEIFDLEFDKIELFPNSITPKSITMLGKDSDELKKLVNKIEKNLGTIQAEKLSFRPQIIIGKIRKQKWLELKKEAKPEIAEKFSMLIAVENIDIVASNFENSESEFSIVESCHLQ